ncbi:MAG: hypothetical protein ABR505_04490 [Actinomycetota bacterium]
MLIFPGLFLLAAVIGWNVMPLRRSLLTTTGVGFGLSALLAVSWTLWNEPLSDVMWWLAQTLIITGLMVTSAAVASWTKARRADQLSV